MYWQAYHADDFQLNPFPGNLCEKKNNATDIHYLWLRRQNDLATTRTQNISWSLPIYVINIIIYLPFDYLEKKLYVSSCTLNKLYD